MSVTESIAVVATDDMPAITEGELEAYRDLRTLIHPGYADAKAAVLRAKLDNTLDVAVVVSVVERDDEVETYPLAILVTDKELFRRLTPAGHEDLIGTIEDTVKVGEE